jgi:hypothetical protein
MRKLAAFLLQELREALVPAVFFFAAFSMGAITKALVLESYGLTPTGLAVAAVGALIVAKAVLIAEHLPITNAFTGRWPIFAIAWKSAIYWVFCLAFRFLEEMIPLWSRYGSLAQAIRRLEDEVSWPLFVAVQLWLVVALLLYTALVELDERFGRGSLWRALVHGTPRVKAEGMRRED